MAAKKYSKTKLASFKKTIEARLDDVEHDLDGIKENLDHNSSGTAGLSLRIQSIVCIWQMLELILTRGKKVIIL